MIELVGKYLQAAPLLVAALVLAALGIMALVLADPNIRHWGARFVLQAMSKLRGKALGSDVSPSAAMGPSRPMQVGGYALLVAAVSFTAVAANQDVNASGITDMVGCTDSELQELFGRKNPWSMMSMPFFLVDPGNLGIKGMNSAAEGYYGRKFTKDLTVNDLVNARDDRRKRTDGASPETEAFKRRESEEFKRSLWVDIKKIQENQYTQWDFIPKVWTDGTNLEVSQLRARRLDCGLYAVVVLDISDQQAFPIETLEAWSSDPKRAVRLGK